MILPVRYSSSNVSSHWSNSINPPTNASRLLITHVTMMVFAAIVVALRLITRYLVVKNPGWDDYMIIVAMVNGEDMVENS